MICEIIYVYVDVRTSVSQFYLFSVLAVNLELDLCLFFLVKTLVFVIQHIYFVYQIVSHTIPVFHVICYLELI